LDLQTNKQGEKTMALLEGKTPEQLAHDIVEEAVESVMHEISGTANQKLETVVRYLNRDKIQARGETWFNKNHDSLVSSALETLIEAREKAIVDYLDKKEQQSKDELFRDLIARGVKIEEAYKAAYNSK
jgi:rRNA processing protein Krr1/Pno1